MNEPPQPISSEYLVSEKDVVGDSLVGRSDRYELYYSHVREDAGLVYKVPDERCGSMLRCRAQHKFSDIDVGFFSKPALGDIDLVEDNDGTFHVNQKSS